MPYTADADHDELVFLRSLEGGPIFRKWPIGEGPPGWRFILV